MQFRSWSGDETVEDTDIGFAIGAALGYEFRVTPRFSLTAEAVFRETAIEFEGSVGTSLLGLPPTVS